MDRRDYPTSWPPDTDVDEERMIVTFYLQDEDGGDVRYEQPFEWKICPICDGKGTHVDPNIDRNGITQEEMDNDPQFFEDYRNGVYDIPCNECKGKRVTPKLLTECPELEAWRQGEYDFQRQNRLEQSMMYAENLWGY